MDSLDFTFLQCQLKEYLIDQLAVNDGSTYIKSRHIADDFNESAKRIGTAMAAIESDPSAPFLMHRRGGNSDGTTWFIKKERQW